MKNSKKDFGIAGQSTTKAKKSQKHDANLQKNSTLYFQIGLILCLLGTYALFEMQFQEKKIVFDTTDNPEIALIDVAPPFVEEVIQPDEPKDEIDRSTVLTANIVEVDDKHKDIESDFITPDEKKPEPKPIAKIGDIPEIDTEINKGPILVDFIKVEKVPVYPGCEKYTTNVDRKKCMSDKITKLINRKFNTDIGSRYGISGRQRINTQFTIDKNGNITDIKIRGPHSALENEAKRVINKIPKMEPGLQGNHPVGVIYTLPILYEAVNY